MTTTKKSPSVALRLALKDWNKTMNSTRAKKGRKEIMKISKRHLNLSSKNLLIGSSCFLKSGSFIFQKL